jgi:predicted transcriptional regulator
MIKMIFYLVTFENRLEEAVDYTMIVMEASKGFLELAKTMKPIDSIVYKALCENKSPFTEEMLKKVESGTDLKGIASNVQRSINRLKNLNMISQAVSRSYRIEKPGLRKFLESK